MCTPLTDCTIVMKAVEHYGLDITFFFILKKKGPQPVKHKAPFLPCCEEKKQP